MTDVISLGEALIDFVPTKSGVKLTDVPGFKKRFGGAPANVAVGLANFGVEVGFVGKVGLDSFGDFIEREFRAHGVNVDHLLRSRRANTTLAFVSLTSEGDRDFVFYRNPGADELLEVNEVEEGYISSGRVLHFGSLSLTGKSSREATSRAIELGRSSGSLISMDPNVRFSLWPDRKSVLKEIKDLLSEVDLLKLSEEEARLLGDDDDLKSGVTKLEKMGPDLVVVTRGGDGYYCRLHGAEYSSDGYDIDVVDTTGAGDGFMAGLLFKLLDDLRSFPELETDLLAPALDFANATAALTTTDYGAISSLPRREEVESLLNGQ
ncbi:carbohydrate kinase [Candidatus Bipolaricaulota bacterium]|nr:carbohydrate kinase [Candidatus Bipolaricaulota bacterium]